MQPFARVNTEQLLGSVRRVAKWTGEVEEGPHAQLSAWPGNVANRWVVAGGKKKREADFLERPGRDLWSHVYARAEGLENVGRSNLARGRAVAVLGNACPSRRGYESRRGGYVEGAQAVAAGSTGVEQRTLYVQRYRARAHCADGSHQLAAGLALEPQGDEKRADLGRGRLTVHDEPDRAFHDLGRQIITRHQLREYLLHPLSISPAFSSARIMPRIFASHSACSRLGSESATIPAPTCMYTLPPLMSAVRIAMQVSRLPE